MLWNYHFSIGLLLLNLIFISNCNNEKFIHSTATTTSVEGEEITNDSIENLIEKSKLLKNLLLNKIYRKFDDDDDDSYENLKEQDTKRGLHMQVYYEPKFMKDGSVLLVPKDKNKGHYFIG
jgi:hypothetical protein